MKVSGAAVRLYGTQAISEPLYISCLPPSPPLEKFEALGSPQCPKLWIISPPLSGRDALGHRLPVVPQQSQQ